MTNGLRSNNTNQKVNNLLENDFIDLNHSVKGIIRRKKYFFTFGLDIVIITPVWITLSHAVFIQARAAG